MQGLGRRVVIASAAIIVLVVLLAACTAGGGVSATISNPTATAYTNGDLAIQVTVAGAPETVELRVDGALLATLQAPFAYTWSTTGTAEGTYELTAVARRGGRSAVSAPRTVVVDRTRPIVEGRTPAPNATNVWRGDPIVVHVSEPILASTVTTGSVALERVGGAPVASTVRLSEAGTAIVVEPTESVSVPAELRLTLSEAITDRAGNALVVPAPWTWAMPYWHWMGSERVNVDPTLRPQYSLITPTPDGHPLVAWFEERGGTQSPVDVYVTAWSGDGWQLLGDRVNGDDRVGLMYSVHGAAVDAAGTPYVGWTSATTARQGWVHRWTGSSWESVGDAHFTGSATSEATVAVVVDADGHPVTAWVARTAPGNDGSEVRVSRWTGSDWVQLGTPRQRVADRGSTFPHLVLGDDGRPVVAWMERVDATVDSPWTVYVDRWTGSDWEPLGGSLRGASTTALLPRLARDAATVTVVLGHLVGSTDNLRYAVRRWDEATGSWDTLGLLRSSAATTVDLGSLTVDTEGRAIATWVERRPAEGGGSTSFTVTQRWTGAQWASLGEGRASYYSWPDVAVGTDGVVYRTVHVDDTDPSHPHVRVYRSNEAP